MKHEQGPDPARGTILWFLILAIVVLLASPASAQRVRQITKFDVTHLGNHAVDDLGSVAFFTSDIDPLGTNPQGLMQVFKKTLPGGTLVQVTALDADAYYVSASDDGGSMVQLTNHPAEGGDADNAVLAGGAGKVLFYLFRGYGGDLSWGQASIGDERVPGGGSCTDGSWKVDGNGESKGSPKQRGIEMDHPQLRSPLRGLIRFGSILAAGVLLASPVAAQRIRQVADFDNHRLGYHVTDDALYSGSDALREIGLQ